MPRPDFPVWRYDRRGRLIRPLEEDRYERNVRPRSWSQLQRGRRRQAPGFVVNTNIGPAFAGFGNAMTALTREAYADEAAAQQDENMSSRDYRAPSTSLGANAQSDSSTARGYRSLPFMDGEYDSDEYGTSEFLDDDSDEYVASEHVEDISIRPVPQPIAPRLPRRFRPRSPLRFELQPSPCPTPQSPQDPRRRSMRGDIGRPSMAEITEEENAESEPMDWEPTPPATPTDSTSSRLHEARIDSQAGPANQGLRLEHSLTREDSKVQEGVSMPDANQNRGPSRVS